MKLDEPTGNLKETRKNKQKNQN
jgi:hypothetical protein